MKYGQTLQQRSIPEWGPYNVDYNDIKHLIKTRTSRGQQPQAIAIPGSSQRSPRLSAGFEEELFAELLEQHQRIDLFVKSKSGEIRRRLDHLNKQVIHLRRRDFPVSRTRLPISRLEKWSKAEGDVLKAGDEVQALSRFVGAQRLAFIKLLKKYKKWTGSCDLGERFTTEVLGHGHSFSRQDFEPLLAQWAQVLLAVRAPFENGARSGSAPSASSIPKQTPASCAPSRPDTRSKPVDADSKDFTSDCAQLHTTAESGSDVDFDTTLALSPLSRWSNKAIYWVHADHIIELQVLLLQYTRLRVAPQRRQSSSGSGVGTPSSAASHRDSGDVSNTSSGAADEESGVLICDDLERFAQDQSRATVNDVEHGLGRVPERAVLTARWSADGDAVAVLRDEPISSESLAGDRRAQMKRKYLESLFDTGPSSTPSQSEVSPATDGEDRLSTLREIQSWLADHREIKPLVEIQSRRTRFVGLGNDPSRGVWATLDRDVSMQKAKIPSERGGKSPCHNDQEDGLQGTFDHDPIRFPHAVLEVRCEGQAGIDLVQVLDKSHLTERVRGFSIEAHAVAVLCNPACLPPLFWLPLLHKDIRKLPASSPHNRKRTLNTISPESGIHTKSNSTSATSITDVPASSGSNAAQVESPATSVPDQLESPPLSSFKKKRRKIRTHPLRKEVEASLGSSQQPQQQRYWNEYDDGEEGSEDEPYTIYIDPNASTWLSGRHLMGRLSTTVLSPFRSSTQRFKTLFTSATPPQSDERTPLINDYFNQRPDIEGSATAHASSSSTDSDSDSASDSTSLSDPSSSTNYATFHPHSRARARHTHRSYRHHHTSSDAHDRLLTLSSIGCFILSILLLITQGALLAARSSTSTARLTLDTSIVIAAIAGIGVAMLALGLMLLRTYPPAGWRQVAGLVGFAVVCIGSATMLAVVGVDI